MCEGDNNMKKKIIVICILIVIVIIGCIIYSKYNYNNYLAQLNSCVKQKAFEKYSPVCKFNDENKTDINISVLPSFCEEDYDVQKYIINKLTNDCKSIYCDYRNKQIIKGSKNIEIYICANDDVIVLKENYIMKNGEEYTESVYLKEKISNKISADETYISYLSELSDVNMLKSIDKIEDVKVCKNEILYVIAQEKIKNNEDKSAIEILSNIYQYKDSKKIIYNLNYLHEFDGTWEDINPYYKYKWIINGNNWYKVFSEGKVINQVGEYYCTRDNNSFNLVSKDKILTHDIEYSNDTLVEHYGGIVGDHIYSKVSDDIDLPETIYRQEPTIGMTENEVRASTWGKPKDINKSTYSWGVHEQWVYGNGRYIYFEDGIVTSISE